MSDETRRQRVVLETDHQRIVGEVMLPAEGFRTRLSDMLNSEGLIFVALADAEITDHDSGDVLRQDFVAVARDHVRLAYEA
ncbi:MAG: hypothetical protein FJW90_03335 [Actinobacteria bacterium]|nr:hypothetical protein [Actinomycetota bacterium]